MLYNSIKNKLIAPNEVHINRIEKCLDCNHFSPYLRRCKQCGCFMMLKSKLKLSKCPKGFWND